MRENKDWRVKDKTRLQACSLGSMVIKSMKRGGLQEEESAQTGKLRSSILDTVLNDGEEYT